jgi:hypothetical protein
MKNLAAILFLALFFSGCSRPRNVQIPYSFLDSNSFPPINTYKVERQNGESVNLVLPDGGTEQATCIYKKDYSPELNDSISNGIIASKRAHHGQKMIYNLDTLSDGRYVMLANGDGYGGAFYLEIKTEK